MLKEHELIVCPNPKCQAVFENLIVVSDKSKTPAERYYGCPNCLMNLDVVSVTAKKKEEKESKTDTSESEKPETEVDIPPGCPHHLGYLSTRGKDEDILQECLTCKRVLECLLKIKSSEQ